MRNRKAFTLVELLVVIGIIALLAGILLPVLNHVHRTAQITGQKADFQTIATALEQYKADFGDYPRNPCLPTWNTLPASGTTPAPVFYSLAVALIGPGPAVTETVGTNLVIGDGSDGPGFRCQTSGAIPNASASPVTVAAGATSVTIPVDSQYTAQASALQGNFVSPSATPASITFFPTSSDPYPETVGILSVPSFSAGKLTLNLELPGPAAAHNGNCLITQPGGKVWGPYISADTFKVAFIPATATDTSGKPVTSLSGLGQPVLLDRWGQVIQYFPAYGPVGNRTNDSYQYTTPAQIAAVSVGPLFGYSQPWSLEKSSGGTSHAQNAIWDFRDAAPTFSTASLTSPTQPWPDPTFTPLSGFNPQYAIQWMLGDQPDSTGNFANAITTSDKLSYSGPYILISAGPDGPGRTNGGFCNMGDSSGNPLPPNTLQQVFINSGNIYNFDRQ